jgi:hypothetical protein
MPRGNKRITLEPPSKGLKTDVPPHLIPDGYLAEGQNAICRDSGVQTRNGFNRITDTADPFSDATMGLIDYIDQDGITARGWAISKTKVSEWSGSGWTDRTGGVNLTGGNTNQARMTVLQTATSTKTVMVNNVDLPQVLISGGNRAAATTLNNVQAAKDCCTAFQRVILGNLLISGVRAPSTLVISDKDDPNTYPALNRVDLSDTNDTIVALQALTTQAFAIYKDNSVWVGIGAPNIYPFTFEQKAFVPGPCSPGAVVAAYGNHYYLGQDAMIYKFDGNTVTPVGANVYRTLQADMDFTKADRVHSYFDLKNGEIWWFWASVNYDPGSVFPTSAIMYNVRTDAFSTICRFQKQFSASTHWKLNLSVMWSQLGAYTWNTIGGVYGTWDAFPVSATFVGLIGSNVGRQYSYGIATLDEGAVINMSFDLPLRDLLGDGRLIRVDAVETYWNQASAPRNVAVTLRTSNNLLDSGVEQPVQSFDLSVDQRKLATYSNQIARWVGVTHQITGSNGGDKYRGLTYYLYDRSEV